MQGCQTIRESHAEEDMEGEDSHPKHRKKKNVDGSYSDDALLKHIEARVQLSSRGVA